MGHLLDTDVVIDFLKGDLPTERLIDPLVQAGIALSMITYMEIYQGIVESPDSAALEVEFEAFLKTVKLLPLSTDAARRCARLRAALKQQGKRIRPRALDLITAATALEHRLTLVTRNRADYDDVPGLALL